MKHKKTHMHKFKLVLLFCLTITASIAQDLSKLNPEQMAMYKKYMAGKTATNTTANPSVSNVEVRALDSTETSFTKKSEKAVAVKQKIDVFGSHLFANNNITFEPKLNIATPPNYILGTYDELIIDISGLYEANYKLKVSPEGTIRIPNISPIKVAGISIQNATRLIRNQIATVYSGVAGGDTKVNVTLGSIRSIRITVLGEAVRPGTYTLPSLATAFNALYAAGGPGEMGSMRNIKVIRFGKTIASIDVYKFLLDGSLSNNVALQDDDVLKIEPYKTRVSISGAVKHNGIFEMLDKETFTNLLNFAGGYTDKAYKQKMSLTRLLENEKTLIDVTELQLATFVLKSGDACTIPEIQDIYNNKVEISGAVFRPGTYALEPGLTIRQLITKAEGIKEDAYLNNAFINRKKANKIPEVISFNLGDILMGRAPDIELQKDDQVEIVNLFDFRQGQSVSILGSVIAPGSFSLIDNMTLKGLIYKAKGFSEMALTDSVELVRRIKDQKVLLESDKKTIVFKFSFDKDLNLQNGAEDMLLENGDQVIVRNIPGFEPIRIARIEGEVLLPGNYSLLSKSDRISDIIKRAGGFNAYAYTLGAYLIRYEKNNGIENAIKQRLIEGAKKQISESREIDMSLLKETGSNSIGSGFDKVQDNIAGIGSLEAEANKIENFVGINLKEIMQNPHSNKDLKLEDGDVLYIPRKIETVRILGEVLFPTDVQYEKSRNLRRYIDAAGGFSENAKTKKVFVLYPNGTAKSTGNFLGIHFYPRVKTGCQIIVPVKPLELKTRLTTVETIAIFTSISSSIALIYSILTK